MAPLDSRQQLLLSLQGQEMYLPDLWPYFAHWPTAVNPGVDRLRKDESDWLDANIPSPRLRAAFKKADFSLLGAASSPWASYERLRIASLLIVWIFVVDDELDMEDATLVDDLEASNRYRHDLIELVRDRLGLSKGDTAYESRLASDIGYSHIIQSFTEIGDAIRKAYNIEQRQRLFDNIKFYLDMTKAEQCSRLGGGIPSPQEYWTFRDGASAVEATLAMIEFLGECKGLPAQVFEDPDMKKIWTLTNVNVSCVNDIFSCKKEMAGLSIANTIPIFYAAATDSEDRLQAATERAVDLIARTISEVDVLTDRLMLRYGSDDPDDETTKELQILIDGCKTWCTGNLYWSYETKRYGKLGEKRSKDGSLTIQL
ncbi:Germacrene A synthase [Lasiodiplodia hormozganensis]|uniref:Terpene synthase n=1 Tax=Lasiodiplodia hormozganensis TaxID=869390 RepID=A0AA39XUF8_9PEZI|nr:Germacrene A synthase [Lasiodiplodia hormozganensis]